MLLRVLSYNVGMRSQERFSQLIDAIQDLQPDVAALLDIEDSALADAFGKELGMTACHGSGRNGWGIALLSKVPIASFQNYPLEPLFHTLVSAEVRWDGRPLNVFATHLRGVGPDGRTALEARRRAVEAEAILDVVRPAGSQPVLLLGDFNVTPPGERAGPPPPGTEWWSANYHRVPYARRPIDLILGAGFVDCFRHRHADEVGFTIHTHHPWSRIDFAFVSLPLVPHLRSCEVATAGAAATASHHFPLWAEFD